MIFKNIHGIELNHNLILKNNNRIINKFYCLNCKNYFTHYVTAKENDILWCDGPRLNQIILDDKSNIKCDELIIRSIIQ